MTRHSARRTDGSLKRDTRPGLQGGSCGRTRNPSLPPHTHSITGCSDSVGAGDRETACAPAYSDRCTLMFSPDRMSKMRADDARLVENTRRLVQNSRDLIAWSQLTASWPTTCDINSLPGVYVFPATLIQVNDADALPRKTCPHANNTLTPHRPPTDDGQKSPRDR